MQIFQFVIVGALVLTRLYIYIYNAMIKNFLHSFSMTMNHSLLLFKGIINIT